MNWPAFFTAFGLVIAGPLTMLAVCALIWLHSKVERFGNATGVISVILCVALLVATVAGLVLP